MAVVVAGIGYQCQQTNRRQQTLVKEKATSQEAVDEAQMNAAVALPAE